MRSSVSDRRTHTQRRMWDKQIVYVFFLVILQAAKSSSLPAARCPSHSSSALQTPASGGTSSHPPYCLINAERRDQLAGLSLRITSPLRLSQCGMRSANTLHPSGLLRNAKRIRGKRRVTPPRNRALHTAFPASPVPDVIVDEIGLAICASAYSRRPVKVAG